VFTFKSVPFIKLTFGEKYLDSAMPAIILLWSQVFLFFSFLGSDLLIAYNSQKWNFVYAILIVSANLLLNLILLPHYNFVGAGLSKLGSSFLGALFLAFVLRKEKINYFIGNVKVILWMLIMIIALFFLSLLPLYLYILVVLICIFITLRYYLFFDYDEVVEIAKTLSLQKWVFKIFRMN
jgi:O-antigen/teichoic acid export membrane protein